MAYFVVEKQTRTVFRVGRVFVVIIWVIRGHVRMSGFGRGRVAARLYTERSRCWFVLPSTSTGRLLLENGVFAGRNGVSWCVFCRINRRLTLSVRVCAKRLNFFFFFKWWLRYFLFSLAQTDVVHMFFFFFFSIRK